MSPGLRRGVAGGLLWGCDSPLVAVTHPGGLGLGGGSRFPIQAVLGLLLGLSPCPWSLHASGCDMCCQTPSLSSLLCSRFLFTIGRVSFDASRFPTAAQAECAGADGAVQLHVCPWVHAACPALGPCLSGLGVFQMLSEPQKGSGGCWKKRLCGGPRRPCARAQTLGTAMPGAQWWPPGSPSLGWACSWALGGFWQPLKRQKNKEPNLPQRNPMWVQARSQCLAGSSPGTSPAVGS